MMHAPIKLVKRAAQPAAGIKQRWIEGLSCNYEFADFLVNPVCENSEKFSISRLRAQVCSECDTTLHTAAARLVGGGINVVRSYKNKQH